MKILISIQPQHLANILNGIKILELRKSMPKCDLPCEAIFYCTKDKNNILAGTPTVKKSWKCWNRKDWNKQEKKDVGLGKYNGKVVAKFTLKQIDRLEYRHINLFHTNQYVPTSENPDYEWEKHSCVDYGKIVEYGKGAPLFAWHIDDLIIYDEPKELSNFQKDLDCDNYPCNKGKFCEHDYYDYSEGCKACEIDFDGSHCIYKQLKRPPQSWCYVEVS